MPSVRIKKVEAVPGNPGQISPPPTNKAVVTVELKIDGVASPVEIQLWTDPLTTFDAAVENAQKNLVKCVENLLEEVKEPLLPPPDPKKLF